LSNLGAATATVQASFPATLNLHLHPFHALNPIILAWDWNYMHIEEQANSTLSAKVTILRFLNCPDGGSFGVSHSILKSKQAVSLRIQRHIPHQNRAILYQLPFKVICNIRIRVT
jgi:hypothetical protein